MTDPQSLLKRNSVWMVISRFAAQGLAVFFTVLLARRLGSTGFGAFAFIAAILFVANALTTFGTDMLLIREIAAEDDLSGLPAALTVQLALSAVFLGLVWSFGAWIPNQSREAITALKVYSLTLIPLAFFTVFTTALRGKQLMDLYALLNIVVSLLQVGAVWMLRENNLVSLAYFLVSVQILAALAAGLVCTFAIPRFWAAWRPSFLPPFDIAQGRLSSLLKAAAPIAFLTLLTMLYQRLGVTMLSLMTNPSDTGIFSAAARVVEASKTAHIAVFAALYPIMANAMSLRVAPMAPRSNLPISGEIGSSGFGTPVSTLLAKTYLKILMAGAVLISLSLFAIAYPLVLLLYGNEFILSANVLQILGWSLIPFTINTYLTLSFLASKQEQLVGRALAVSLLGMLILNLWWIPARGPEGGAWASLVAECLQAVVLLASMKISLAKVSLVSET